MDYTEWVCCWSTAHVHDYIAEIGTVVGEERLFLKYAESFNRTGIWDGMRVVSKSLHRHQLNDTDNVYIPI